MEKAKTPTVAEDVLTAENARLERLLKGWQDKAERLGDRLLLADLRPADARAQAFASLVALAERSSVLSVNLGQILGGRRWCATLEFVSGDLLDAVADSPEAAVKAVEEKMQEREDIQSGLMEDT